MKGAPIRLTLTLLDYSCDVSEISPGEKSWGWVSEHRVCIWYNIPGVGDQVNVL